MKCLIALCVLSVLAAVYGTPHSRGCIYVMGRCQRECEEGTHAYTTGCGHKTPEPSCEEPNPAEEKAIICDYTACYCDPPTLRDPVSGKCVKPEQCPKKEK